MNLAELEHALSDPATVKRFWSKVDRRGPDECWMWMTGKSGGGYGAFKVNGMQVSSHRAAWYVARGPWPVNMDVVHTCHVRDCCNPSHLYAGNARDANRHRAITADKFWAKFKSRIGDECWPWPGARHRTGYGRIKVNGISCSTHRFAWEVTFGQIPENLFVCHKCDNPPCCNPEHLFLGTGADNSADMAEKGRSARGARHPNHKLTEQQVAEIRSSPESKRKIAARIGVSPAAIWFVRKRKTWGHIA